MYPHYRLFHFSDVLNWLEGMQGIATEGAPKRVNPRRRTQLCSNGAQYEIRPACERNADDLLFCVLSRE